MVVLKVGTGKAFEAGSRSGEAMAQKRGTRALPALSFVLSLTSCASPPTSVDASTPAPDTVQPTLSTQVLGPDGKTSSENANEADCVLSSGSIHLWCNWISRFY